MSIDAVERMIRNRVVTADAVLQGQADLRSYPFRLLLIEGNHPSVVISAAEHLSNYGWDLINMYGYGSHGSIIHAVMKRDLSPEPEVS
jgi:hypothetical protein